MTTIAATRTQIAGDHQLTHGAGYKFKGASKVYEYENEVFYDKPFAVGFCGVIDTCLDVLNCFDEDWDSKLPKGWKRCEFLVLTQDGKIFTFNNPLRWIEVREPFYAIGSGSHLAVGAMSAGATAEEAVQAAAKHDLYTGFGTTAVTFV